MTEHDIKKVMSSGQVIIVYVSAGRELKIDSTETSPGDMAFVTVA